MPISTLKLIFLGVWLWFFWGGGRVKWDSIDYFSFVSTIDCVCFSLKQIIALRSLSLPLSSNVDMKLILLLFWSHAIIVLTCFHSWFLLILSFQTALFSNAFSASLHFYMTAYWFKSLLRFWKSPKGHSSRWVRWQIPCVFIYVIHIHSGIYTQIYIFVPNIYSKHISLFSVDVVVYSGHWISPHFKYFVPDVLSLKSFAGGGDHYVG